MRPSSSLRVRVAGEALTLLPPGLVWWERQRTLVVADLHLGPGRAARVDGAEGPATVDEKDLEELAAVATERSADRLIVLGDFLQAPAGAGAGGQTLPGQAPPEQASAGAVPAGEAPDRSVPERHAPDAARAARAWRERLGVPVWLLLGNHDGAIRADPGAWAFDRVDHTFTEGPFLFTHRHRDLGETPTKGDPFRMAGHLHPVVRLEGRNRLQLRCFVLDPDQLILPAFGRMTSGAVVEPQPGRRRYPVTGDEVFDLSG